MEPSFSDVLDLWRLYAIWFLQLIAVPAGLGIASAVIGVVIFGPRQVDSLILPGMAVFGVVLVALRTGALSTDAPAALVTVATAVGVGVAGIQREIGDRLTETSPSWSRFVGLGAIGVGMAIGGVLAYAIWVREDWPIRVAVGAAVGGVIGTMVRDARQPGDLDGD